MSRSTATQLDQTFLHFGATVKNEHNSYNPVHVDTTAQLKKRAPVSGPQSRPTQTATIRPNPTQSDRPQGHLSDAMTPNPHRTQTEKTKPTQCHGPPQLSSTRDDTSAPQGQASLINLGPIKIQPHAPQRPDDYRVNQTQCVPIQK